MSCGGPPRGWWCSGLLLWVERVDDNQFAAAAWTRDCKCSGLVIGALTKVAIGLIRTWRFNPEQFPDPCDIGRAVAVSEEAIVADAVLASWEHVEQETADELGHSQRHCGVAASTFKTVIFDAEGDALVVHADQATVRDCDPMGIARQVCQHGFRPSEVFLGIDNPVDLAQRFEGAFESIPVGKVRKIAKKLQLSGFVQFS